MEHVPRLSEAVYVGMCQIAGTPTMVSIRRMVIDSAEAILNFKDKYTTGRTFLSGSDREGFCLPGSDVDYMIWQCDHKLLCDLNQADRYNTQNCTLILMETIEDRPGFVMLQLLTPTNNRCVRRSRVRHNDIVYVSSSKFRENSFKSYGSYTGLGLSNSDCTLHGPCTSGSMGRLEFDLAFCFHSPHWPSAAEEFIDRCLTHKWPSFNVLRDIISAGCHVVPIGLKGSPQENAEWRTSFSSAEQKLVYSMNHTQFMCYGLLKIFLKGVLNITDEHGSALLCSYFMKTLLFWVIQSNSIVWSPSNLLPGFWMCFKSLISCVQRGYLPNFFIPENNMFRAKIHGHSQELLCGHLLELYNKGIACLLHCPSIRHSLMKAILNRSYVVSTLEAHIVSEARLDIELVNEKDKTSGALISRGVMPGDSFTMLASVIKGLVLPLSSYQQMILRMFCSEIIRYIADHLLKLSDNTTNRRKVKIYKSCEKLMKISVRFGCLSDAIYLAVFYCITGDNKKAIRILEPLRRDIAQPYVIYNGRVSKSAYRQEVGGRPLKDKMKKAASMDLAFPKCCMLIQELKLEHTVSNQSNLDVPPRVMTLMLLVLCNHGNSQKQQEVLDELYTLVHSYDELYVDKNLRDISWQILGICQQICGDHQGALMSYRESLEQDPYHGIQEATYRRIQDACSRI